MKLCPSAAALSRSIKTMTVRYYDCFHLTRRHKPTPFANSEWTKSMTKNKSLNIQTQVLRIEDMNSFIWPEFFLFLVEWSVYDTWNLERPEFGWIRRLCKLEVANCELRIANCELRRTDSSTPKSWRHVWNSVLTIYWTSLIKRSKPCVEQHDKTCHTVVWWISEVVIREETRATQKHTVSHMTRIESGLPNNSRIFPKRHLSNAHSVNNYKNSCVSTKHVKSKLNPKISPCDHLKISDV